jgi:hypothetical protein
MQFNEYIPDSRTLKNHHIILSVCDMKFAGIAWSSVLLS